MGQQRVSTRAAVDTRSAHDATGTCRLAQLLDQRQRLALQAALEAAIQARVCESAWPEGVQAAGAAGPAAAAAARQQAVPAGGRGARPGRRGAVHHGLAALTLKPSPPRRRAAPPRALPGVGAGGAPAARTRVEQLHQLIGGQVQQLVQVDAAEGELAEGALLGGLVVRLVRCGSVLASMHAAGAVWRLRGSQQRSSGVFAGQQGSSWRQPSLRGRCETHHDQDNALHDAATERGFKRRERAGRPRRPRFIFNPFRPL